MKWYEYPLQSRTKEFLKALDPSLEYVEVLKGSLRYDCVFKVRSGDTFYILKAATEASSHYPFLTFERDALKDCADVSGITHLVQDYGVVGDHSAFLKEYADGFHFSRSRIPSSSRAGLNLQLTAIVKTLHERGYFGLDLQCANLIVSPDFERITIIDPFYDQKCLSSNSDLAEVYLLFKN